MISVSWGDNNENVPGTPEDVPEWINQGIVKCRHDAVSATGRKRKCSCKLKPIDDASLAYASTFGIKTKTRVGDVWDKAGCVEPRESHHETFRKHGEDDARYVETEFSKRNKRRLADIRKKRQTEKQGEVLKKPTKNRSSEKISKNQALKQSRKDYD
jgi:hypothetical protein